MSKCKDGITASRKRRGPSGGGETREDRLQVQLNAALTRIENLTAALQRIADWSDAYPLEMFNEPDWKKSKEVLEAAGLSLDRISAANMRHVVLGVGKIAKEAK
jgi:hypothetical protein